jgi:23S rRNA (uracil1939-C5)-methyltransferase
MSFPVTIERLIPGGRGLAFHQGRAVFVPLCAPGDRILVHRVRDRRNYLEAQSIEIVEKSPQRVIPPCPYFGDCGGCDFQQLAYEHQLSSKGEILLDALARIGKIKLPTSKLSLIPSPQAFGYRNRLQLKIGTGPSSSWGFFAVGSHRVCSVKHCLIASEELWQFLFALQRLLEVSPRVRNSLAEVEVFQGRCNEFLVDLRLGTIPWSLEDLKQELQRSGADWERGKVSLFLSVPSGEAIKVSGSGHIWKTVSDFEYRVSRGSFFQINDSLLDRLLDAAVGGLSGAKVLDLYCGVGFFSLALARSFEEVWAVEKNPFAVEDLRENLLRNQVRNVKVFFQDLDSFLQTGKRSLEGSDLILLDPPRSGLSKESVCRLAEASAFNFVYVSCDPSTLARDLAIFVNHQYEISSMTLLDLFPQTHHLEVVARLIKRVDRT